MDRKDITAEGLRVGIGFPSAVMLVIGGIIGVGIFVNPAVVARGLTSPVLVLSAWALGGVIALLGAFVYAELAARMPNTGGEYVYLRDTYGPLAGFLFGWTTLLVVQAGGMAAVTIVFARNVNVLAGGALPERAVVVATLAGLAGVNCLGVKSGNGVQGLLGALKVAAIAAVVLAGLFIAPQVGFKPAEALATASADPLKAFGAAMIPVVFSYGGWQTANYVAGEIRDPSRNLARALLVGVIAVITHLSAGQYRLRAGFGGEAAGRNPHTGFGRVAARHGAGRGRVGGLGHRPVGDRLSQPGDAHRSAGLFRHGEGWTVLPACGAGGRQLPRAGDLHRAAGGLDRLPRPVGKL